ncbi:hypothetical protein BC938DRAFT_476400 [Jimgerdemannia flammicorona]|nr:hypothetical protein BC938DRAFT_476400 [Jimgerdemannia flammicorona]
MSQPTYLSEDTLYARLQQTTHHRPLPHPDRHYSDDEDHSEDEDELDSLHSYGLVDDTDDTDEYDVEEEWEENKRQIQLIFSMVIFPYMGKFLGRKFSFYLWGKMLNF